jgi:uncharacterized protein YegL
MSIKNAYYMLSDNNLPIDPVCDSNYKFGVLVVDVNEVPVTLSPIFILFTVDSTGSMSDYVTSHTTKMQYVIQTLKSIIKYLSTQLTDVYVQINTFNETVDELIPPIKVTTENVKDITSKINTIEADGTTNIENALKSATSSIHKHSNMNPNHSCVHIFMTDGEPNSGASTSTELLNHVSNNYLSINIGFGTDHNAKLLCELSSNSNSEYHFIDRVENASIIYGESLHKVLYPAINNVNINIENGAIYDWNTNEWNESLYENTIIGDVKKYYHIKTSTVESLNISLTGTIFNKLDNNQMKTLYLEEKIEKLPDLIDINGDIVTEHTISKFAFRQCVLELLYKSIHTKINKENIEELKSDIQSLFRVLRTFANDNELIKDGIIKQLMNDLYLAYWNVGNVYGDIYIYGRHTSQGNQLAHTPGNHYISTNYTVIDIETPPRPELRRLSRHHDNIFNFDNINTPLNLDLDMSVVGETDTEYSCYSTPGVRNTTSSIQTFDNDSD